ncbi:hypothetical protein [Bradyrhizobium sp. STM 3561]
MTERARNEARFTIEALLTAKTRLAAPLADSDSPQGNGVTT